MRTIFAEYNPQRNSIDVYTSAGYMLRIDCWEAEKNLKTTPGSDCALNALAIDKPLENVKIMQPQRYYSFLSAEILRKEIKLYESDFCAFFSFKFRSYGTNTVCIPR